MSLRAEAKSVMQERILGVARTLFYGRGIQAVGVDVIAAEVGISKRTLYNHFPSKGDLVRAYLEGWNQPTHASGLPPRERILADFDRLERSFARTAFRGCPFINAVAEAAHPADDVGGLSLATDAGWRWRDRDDARAWRQANCPGRARCGSRRDGGF